MSLQKPYFKDIKGVGSLDIEYIIFQADYPVIFTCVDKFNQLYLCVCCDIRKEQRWIISKTTAEIVKNMLCDKITLYDSFKSPYNKNYIIKWSYETQEENAYEVNFDDIDDLDLPMQDEYIEAMDDEFKEYIDQLTARENNYQSVQIDISTIKVTVEQKPKIRICTQYRQNCKHGDMWNRIAQNVPKYSSTRLFSSRNEHSFIYNQERINADFVSIKPTCELCYQYSN
jgi:hypothetical protein